MERKVWSEEEIEKYITEGWSLSYDKTNNKFKLQKRIGKKVKSYTLPKEFNEFCQKLKEEMNLTKGKPLKEIYKIIEKEDFITKLVEEEDLGWENTKKLFEKYCEEKSKKLTPEDVAKMSLYSYFLLKKSGGIEVIDLLSVVDLLEYNVTKLRERVDNISFALRHALGIAGIKIRCPKCREWSYLKYDKGKKKWVCSKCGKVPF